MLDYIPPKTKQNLIVMCVGLALASAAAGYHFIVAPANKQWVAFNLQKITQAKKKEALDEIRTLQTRLDVYRPQLAENSDFSWFIETVNEVAQKSGLTLISAAPSQDEPKGDYRKLVMRVEASGGYHDVGRFVSFIESCPRFIKVQQLALSAGAGKTAEGTSAVFTLIALTPVTGAGP